MNSVSGFLGSYFDGFAWSNIPPWGVARCVGVAEAAAAAAVTVCVTVDAMIKEEK